MQIMYGVKVLNKLVAAWEAEAANRGYLEENTVRASSLVVIVSVIIFFQISSGFGLIGFVVLIDKFLLTACSRPLAAAIGRVQSLRLLSGFARPAL